MSCNPSTLQSTGKDFYRLSARDLEICKVRLLCVILLNYSPATDVTASAIMSRGKDFYRLSDRGLEIVIDQLLCVLKGGCVTPVVPSGFSVGIFPAPVQLTWLAPAMTPTSTQVWRSLNGAAYTLLSTVDGTVLSYLDNTAFSPGDTICYKIRFVTGACLGTFTAVNCQTVPIS